MSDYKIFVISLKDSERRPNISRQLEASGVSFEFFDAIDGRYNQHPLFEHYDDAVRKKYRRRALSGGELGCWASHFLLWQRCVQLNQPIVILEDDTNISESLQKDLRFLSEYIGRFTYIRLAATYSRKFKNVIQEDGRRIVRLKRGPAGTQGYMIAPEAARVLLDYSKKWYLAVDEFMDRFWVHGVDSYMLLPSPIMYADIGGEIVRLNKERLGLTDKLMYEARKILDALSRILYNLRK